MYKKESEREKHNSGVCSSLTIIGREKLEFVAAKVAETQETMLLKKGKPEILQTISP